MQLNFDAFQYDPTQGGGVCFPLGDYRLEITKVEPLQVKDNPGAGYLAISLTVVDGDLKGMTQIDRLNIYNPSEQAKQIALRRLATYAFAINRPQLATTEQMIGGRLIATIGPQLDNDKYSEVKVVKCPDGSLPVNPKTGHAAPQTAPAGASAPATSGWGATTQAAPATEPSAGGSPWGAPGTGGGNQPPWAGGGSGASAPASNNPPWVK